MDRLSRGAPPHDVWPVPLPQLVAALADGSVSVFSEEGIVIVGEDC
jgi:hypothetical protein